MTYTVVQPIMLRVLDETGKALRLSGVLRKNIWLIGFQLNTELQRSISDNM